MSIEFTRVPQNEGVLIRATECLCPTCGKGNLTPFKVNTCKDILCGECWQKSAFNLGANENKCLKCSLPTALLCFKDYNRFIGYNLYNGELLLANHGIKDNLMTCEKESEPLDKALTALEQHEKHILSCFLEQAQLSRMKRKKAKALKVLELMKSPRKRAPFERVTDYSMQKKLEWYLYTLNYLNK